MNKKYYSIDKKYKHLGEFFRDKRRDSKVTQQELATAIGISKRQIIRFEQGTPINSTYLLKMMFMLKILSIHSIFHQVEDMQQLNQLLGDNPSPEQKAVLDKTWETKY